MIQYHQVHLYLYIYSLWTSSKGSGEEFSNILLLKLTPHVHFLYLKSYNLFSVYLLNFQISYLDICQFAIFLLLLLLCLYYYYCNYVLEFIIYLKMQVGQRMPILKVWQREKVCPLPPQVPILQLGPPRRKLDILNMEMGGHQQRLVHRM